MANQIRFHQANEIFESLTSKQGGESFAYRGHGQATYKLVPSLQRLGVKDNFLSLEDADMLTASSWPFREFYRVANQMGLPLPSVSYEKHQNYTSESGIDAIFNFADEAEGEYDPDDLEIMAFAQHFQVPTPLLDWSRSPLVAMYFAASGALRYLDDLARKRVCFAKICENQVSESIRQELRDEAEEKHLSIWQANAEALNELTRQRYLMGTDTEGSYSIRFFTPRYQGNQNIVAQQGLFSIHCPHKMTMAYRYADASDKCLSEVVQEHVEWSDKRSGEATFLKEARSKGLLNEYILPYSQSVKLLKLLGSCGIHAASIFPDHQGCARRVQERSSISLIDKLLYGPTFHTTTQL